MAAPAGLFVKGVGCSVAAGILTEAPCVGNHRPRSRASQTTEKFPPPRAHFRMAGGIVSPSPLQHKLQADVAVGSNAEPDALELGCLLYSSKMG